MRNKTLARFGLALLCLCLTIAACRSTGTSDTSASVGTGETVYTRVGMHFDYRGAKYVMYSTNYIGMPHYFPPGTKFTMQGQDSRRIELRNADGLEFVITWTPKHHGSLTRAEWTDRHFAKSPVTLPSGLSAAERDAIGRGVGEAGMSRRALFLAIGYPPKSLTPTEDDRILTYQSNRFIRRTFEFGDDDRVKLLGR